MRLLLDECIDRRLAKELSGHDVETVPRMDWAGFKKSELLVVAEKQFDVFMTVDRNLAFQQNLAKFNIAVVILRAPTNRLADLKLLVPELLAALPTLKKGQIITIGP